MWTFKFKTTIPVIHMLSAYFFHNKNLNGLNRFVFFTFLSHNFQKICNCKIDVLQQINTEN